MPNEKPFGNGRGRPKDDPSQAAVRKIGLLVDLFRDGRISANDYAARYSANERTLQRDLKQLRTIGEEMGFAVSLLKDGHASLTHFDRRPRRVADERPDLLRLIAEVGRALGQPVGSQLAGFAARAPDGDSFIHFHTPTLVAGSRVSEICDALRTAEDGPNGPCMVRFAYITANGKTSERLVEPHHVVNRAGRYYLVAYDRGPSAWRFFALDAIQGVPARAGSLSKRRDIPPNYLSDDVLGFFKGTTPPIAVTVKLSATIAASVTSRSWQSSQQIERFGDGTAQITIFVPDVLEAVRWSFGFAPDAKVIAPETAVRTARLLAAQLIEEHKTSKPT